MILSPGRNGACRPERAHTGEYGGEMSESRVKSEIKKRLEKAARQGAPALVTRYATRPIIQQSLKTTYPAVLKRQMANGASAETAVHLARGAALTKGGSRIVFLEKVAGPAAGFVVSPLVEIGQVAYEDHAKGEERNGRGYRGAPARGAASGAAGMLAAACAGAAAGSVVPGAGTVAGFVAGVPAPRPRHHRREARFHPD